ncbi:chemotaxis protein CheC [Desulfuromonas sp. KJ2020]|uniref:chemotaxis protein CheC n=1 Tax=Desulfuromonas sp. KJ2020 TaxID=2919173 RepID=UPI0020A7A7F6|nr:chemotaxis protein CheC [Desulfuromonas sp. KJ2020]MCP3176005.1 chemotaxis protein CheC [Desulfuromonas sp. KJ2020]
MKGQGLTALQLDALREISHIGMGQGATALSQLLSERVELRVPRVAEVDIAQVPELLGGAETPVVGMTLQIVGDASGDLLLLLSQGSARELLSRLLGRPHQGPKRNLDELDSSALQELANILASVYLGVLGDLLGIALRPSPPSLAADMLGAIVDDILIAQSLGGDTVLMVETEFVGAPQATAAMVGHLFLLPAPSLLAALERRLEEA